jgi:hypothetical protein
MAVPIKPSIKQARRGRQVRPQPEYHREPFSSISSFRYNRRLVWAFIKLGFMVLGAIAGVILISILIFQFIGATIPMSLIGLVIVGLTIWLAARKIGGD